MTRAPWPRAFVCALLVAGRAGLAADAPAPSDATAQAYWEAGLYADALAAADAALSVWPGSKPARLVRSRARVAMALTAVAKRALEAPSVHFDYPALHAALTAALQDFDAAGETGPAAVAERTELLRQLAAVEHAKRRADDERHRLATVAEAKRAAAQREGQRLAEQLAARDLRARQAAAADWDAEWKPRIAGRALGFVFVALALGAGGAVAGSLLGAEDTLGQVKKGGLASGLSISRKLDEVGLLRTVALVSGIGGGVLLLTGILLVAGNPPAPPRPTVTFGLVPLLDGAALTFGGTWP